LFPKVYYSASSLLQIEIFIKSKEILVERVSNELDVAGDDSLKRWLSYKPPE